MLLMININSSKMVIMIDKGLENTSCTEILNK